MSRRSVGSLIREVSPDYSYNSVLVMRMINAIMMCGKKSIAEKIVYMAMERAAKKIKENDVLGFFKKAVENVMPAVEVRSRRIGGATYQIPVEVNDRRSCALALRWIIQSARKKKGSAMYVRLSSELLDAYNERGTAFKIKEDKFKMAESNKAFAHYRW